MGILVDESDIDEKMKKLRSSGFKLIELPPTSCVYNSVDYK